MTPLILDTPHGPARVHLDEVRSPKGALVLGHGAGGSVVSKDLVETTTIAREPTFDVDHVARAVVYMATLPLDANVQFMTVMATNMPFVGRG